MRFEPVNTMGTSFIQARSLSSKKIWDQLSFLDLAEHLPLGVVLLNRHLELERFNHHYAGYIDAYSPCKPGEALGCSYFSVVPGSESLVGDSLKNVLESKKKGNWIGVPLPVQTTNRMKMTFWDVSVVPIIDRRNRCSGMVMMTLEVTDRVESEKVRESKQKELDDLLDALRRFLLHGNCNEGQGMGGRLARSFGLTSREIQVACLLMKGKTSKEIADRLYVSLACVEFHRDNIRKKLGLKHTGTNLSTFLTAFLDSDEPL
jgi:DNA-binding CsgD family transcriptional regulator